MEMVKDFKELHEKVKESLELGYQLSESLEGRYQLKKGTQKITFVYPYEKVAVVYPKRENASINLMSSIAKAFGASSSYQTILKLDSLLDGQKVCLLILDGLGKNILEDNLPQSSFLRSHLLMDLVATYPSTTVAATTSFMSGKLPMETGWIGWHQYFELVKDDVILFRNQGYYSKKSYDIDVAKTVIKYPHFLEGTKTKYENIGPMYFEHGYSDFKEMLKGAKKLFSLGTEFIYAYHDYPDLMLHMEGEASSNVRNLIKELDKDIQEFYESLAEDTILLVTADHGHHSVSPIPLYVFEDIWNLLVKSPSIEGRCTTFFVKDKLAFKERFLFYFKDYFELYTKEELMENGFLGDGDYWEFIGDFTALATNHYYFSLKENDVLFLSSHAGLTQDEMIVPLCFASKKKDFKKF